MSYIRAEEILPKELLEAVQQYVNGQSVYIPAKEKSDWGSGTDTKQILDLRNREIFVKYLAGASVQELAAEYALSEKSIQRIIREQRTQNIAKNTRRIDMSEYEYIDLMMRPELKDTAAKWFHEKWGIPEEAYLACMEEYLSGATKNGWYLCLDGDSIVAGLGVIDNDFHDRKDLTPNVCAVYTEEAYRCQGIAGKLLDMVVEDMKAKGVTPIYLLTDHTSFYERYGWEFLCMAQGDGEDEPSRMYIHK